MAKTTSSFTLGQTPDRFGSGGMTLDEAAQQADIISGHEPEPEPIIEEEKDTRSPTQIHSDNMKEKAREDLMRRQQAELASIPAANEVLAVAGSSDSSIKMDVGEMITGAMPDGGMWDLKDDRATWFSKSGAEYDGDDLANSAFAVEAIISATMGDAVRSIFSRSITAPLDPAFRLQKTAKDAANPVLAELQNRGVISKDYSPDDIGIVSDSSALDVVKEAVSASKIMLEKGNSPDDVMIAIGSRLEDNKQFTSLPDAAKEYVVREIANKTDMTDSNIVTQTVIGVSQMFNNIEQQAEIEVGKEAAKLVIDDHMPVDVKERTGLLEQAVAGSKNIKALSAELLTLDSSRSVLDTPWEIRKQRRKELTSTLDQMKEQVSNAFRRATRDQPREAVDETASVLFDIERDLISEGLNPRIMAEKLDEAGINLNSLSDGDKRKVLLDRVIDRWYVQKSKDPVSAPLYASLRQKMKKTIADGGRLEPSIESAVSGLIGGLKQKQQLEEVQQSPLNVARRSLSGAKTPQELKFALERAQEIPDENERAAVVKEAESKLEASLSTTYKDINKKLKLVESRDSEADTTTFHREMTEAISALEAVNPKAAESYQNAYNSANETELAKIKAGSGFDPVSEINSKYKFLAHASFVDKKMKARRAKFLSSPEFRRDPAVQAQGAKALFDWIIPGDQTEILQMMRDTRFLSHDVKEKEKKEKEREEKGIPAEEESTRRFTPKDVFGAIGVLTETKGEELPFSSVHYYTSKIAEEYSKGLSGAYEGNPKGTDEVAALTKRFTQVLDEVPKDKINDLGKAYAQAANFYMAYHAGEIDITEEEKGRVLGGIYGEWAKYLRQR